MGFDIRDILALPAVYRAWQAPFVKQKLAPLVARNDLRAVRRVLDLGCGPGTNARRFGHASYYLGVDLSPSYVADARRRTGCLVAAADARRLPLVGARFDFVLVNSLLHHIDDAGVRDILSGVAPLLAPGGHVHSIEVVLPPRPFLPRLLARLDRGRYARPMEEWRALFESRFEVVELLQFSVGLPALSCWEMVYFKGRARAS